MATKKNPEALSHRDLCVLAGAWLRRQGHSIILVDPRTTRCEEQPDCIGWKYAQYSTLIEVKTSRGDFLADAKKPHRIHNRGMGQVRYFLAPQGMLRPEEIPEGWGLLEQAGNRILRSKMPNNVGPKGNFQYPKFSHEILKREFPLLIAQLERVKTGRRHHLMPDHGAPILDPLEEGDDCARDEASEEPSLPGISGEDDGEASGGSERR